MNRRAEYIGLRRGVSGDQGFDPQVRMNAIRQMEAQEKELAARVASAAGLLDPWVPLGPAPIPNGQVWSPAPFQDARLDRRASDESQYRFCRRGARRALSSTDGGSNWTAMMDGAISLAIGAMAIAPRNPIPFMSAQVRRGFAVTVSSGWASIGSTMPVAHRRL